MEKEKKYPTIYGFYGRDLWLGLVKNKKDEEVVLFKFMLGQRKGGNLVQWLAVAVQGKAADKFLDLLAQGLTAKDTLSLRGVYQTRTRRNGQEGQEFWAFSIKKVERDERKEQNDHPTEGSSLE